MAARPSILPEWATGGGASVVAPSAGKKSLGWITDERPLAQYVNWILFTIYSWLNYLDNPTDQRQRFPANGGFNDTGGVWIDGGAGSVSHSTNAADSWYVPLPYKTGDTLRSAVARVKPNTRTVTVGLQVYDETGTGIFLAGLLSTTGVAWETVTVDSATVPTPTAGTWDHVMADGEMAFLAFTVLAGSSNLVKAAYGDVYANVPHE